MKKIQGIKLSKYEYFSVGTCNRCRNRQELTYRANDLEICTSCAEKMIFDRANND